MTQFERDEAMMSLIHHNMQLGKMVTLVGQLFENVSPEVSARLYPVWAEAYRSALQDMQNAYNLGVTEQRAKYKYTEEDVINAYRNGVQSRYSRTGEAVLEHTFIQSLRDKIQGGDQ